MRNIEIRHLIWQCFVTSIILFSSNIAIAEDAGPATKKSEVLRFEITGYVVDGALLLPAGEIEVVVAPYVGKDKNFSDVQRALEAVETLYSKHGYTAIQVLLPVQELEKGKVHFRVIESRFNRVTVMGNKHVSDANVLDALPSIRKGELPKSRQIARELKLANENPSRQLNVVLKAGEKETVDAEISVKDKKPGITRVSFDNTGTPETGRTRFGLAYTNANLFDSDHVGSLQLQVSPQHMSSVRVFGGTYKIPLYRYGDSIDFFGGYSNVNSQVGGLSNFQGGGRLLNAHYNFALERVGNFDPRLTFGIDWRDFKRIEQTQPDSAVLYNEVVVTPFSLGYSGQGKGVRSDTNLDVNLSANVPMSSKGNKEAFANYDPLRLLLPDVNYRIVRYGGSYVQAFGQDWQLHTALNGQWSRNVLILGEQMRLGGMYGVRGFAEGSEAGEQGTRWTLEGYTPSFSEWDIDNRALMFFDGGKVSSHGGLHSSITSAGLGLRSTWKDFSARLDLARIGKAGSDPLQKVGDWRGHFELSTSF